VVAADWVRLVLMDMALPSGQTAGDRAQQNPANDVRRVQQRPPTAGLLFDVFRPVSGLARGSRGLNR
jgi:hypothetical protein